MNAGAQEHCEAGKETQKKVWVLLQKWWNVPPHYYSSTLIKTEAELLSLPGYYKKHKLVFFFSERNFTRILVNCIIFSFLCCSLAVHLQWGIGRIIQNGASSLKILKCNHFCRLFLNYFTASNSFFLPHPYVKTHKNYVVYHRIVLLGLYVLF